MNRFIFLCFSLLFTACYYDNKEDLYDYIEVEGGENECEFSDVSYSMDLKAIFDLNCNNACHNSANQFGGVILESHGAVTSFLADGTLMGVIKHEDGFSPMPPSGKLTDCEIDKIQFWINDGAPNN